MSASIWRLAGPASGVLLALYAGGWVLVIGSTFAVSHADLFGLRQAFLYGRHDSCTPPAFSMRGPYRVIRHPLMAGFLIVFWAAPRMTVGHLLFAAAATGYILVGIRFEERDLARQFGAAYHSYQASVPALLPTRARAASRKADS